MRVISMLGSATEILFSLDLGHLLVGISHECDYPPEALSLPRVSRPRFDPAGLTSGEIDQEVRRCMEQYGSVYEVDSEMMAELRPDLVLTQAICEVCAVPTGSVEQAVAELGSDVRVLSLDAHDLDGILQSVEEVAAAAGFPDRGSAVRRDMERRLADLPVPERRPRVLLLEWLDPVFSPGHWVPEMVDRAGGENLIGSAGQRSHEMTWDEVSELDPDLLLIEPCGWDLDKAFDDAERHRGRLLDVAPRAIRQGRAWVLHSAWFSRSGPRVIEGIELLNELFRNSEPDMRRIADKARRWG